MYKYLKKYKGRVFLFGNFLILFTIAAFLIPKILGDYIDSFTKGTSLGILVIYAFIIIAVVETISLYSIRYIRNKISNRITLDMIKDLTAHILKLPMSFFKEQEVLYLSNRVNMDSFNLSDFALKLISDALINSISLVVVFIYILRIDLGIGFKLMLLIPLYLVIYTCLKKPLFNRTTKYKEDINEAMGVMNNQYLDVKVTKINNLYKAYEENLTEYTDKAQSSFESFLKVSFAFDGIDILIKRLALLILIAYSGSLVLNNKLTAGEFTIIIAYFNIAFEGFTGFIEFAKGYQDAKSSYSRVEELLNIKSETNGKNTLNKIEKITLQDITFSYDKDKHLLKNFNYNFQKGKIYCIKGKNGTGKSTLLELILGINEEYQGDIFYNNENIINLDLYNLRTNLISYVEQAPTLIEGTLLKNLTIGLKNYNMDYIKQYCEEFGVHKILPKGYEDTISANNTNLSGGEKQKIVICRALGKNGEVIIMDEPTAALDLKAKEKLKEMLLKIKEKKIIILITHDEDFEKISDEIVNLNL
jgi:ABC-type bacteriocin/lantibiotic exporter with double-glycine peptidase domain